MNSCVWGWSLVSEIKIQVVGRQNHRVSLWTTYTTLQCRATCLLRCILCRLFSQKIMKNPAPFFLIKHHTRLAILWNIKISVRYFAAPFLHTSSHISIVFFLTWVIRVAVFWLKHFVLIVLCHICSSRPKGKREHLVSARNIFLVVLLVAWPFILWSNMWDGSLFDQGLQIGTSSLVYISETLHH